MVKVFCDMCGREIDYEDTGLWPEQVKLLQIGLLKEVNRLKTVAEVAEREGLPVARLQELAEADKDGRVLIPPCKVGDTVYVSYGEGYRPCVVDRIHVLANNEVQIRMRHFITETLWLSASDFGKTVFLTCEEAEKALEAMKNG